MPKASSGRDTKASLRRKKRSQSPRKINLHENPEQVAESSSPTSFLSKFRSKLAGGREVKALIRNMKKMAGVTHQSQLVKCPNCKKMIQEPKDVPTYKCEGCDTVLRVNIRETDRKAESSLDETKADNENDRSASGEGSLHQNNEIGQNEPSSSITKQPRYYDLEPSTSRGSFQSTEFSLPGSITSPQNNIYSPEVSYYGRSSQFNGAYIHERVNVPQGTPRRDKFQMSPDFDMMHMRATDSPYNMYSQPTGNWISQGREYYVSPTPFSTTSSYSSAMYENASPFHPSYVSTPETHHGRSYQRSYGGLEWTNEANFSQTHFLGETTERRYSQALGQSPLPAFLYQGYYGHNLDDSYTASAATSQKYLYTGYHSTEKSRTASHELNGHVNEKTSVAKRHLLPMKGGAPFVTCYHCLKVLRVPQDSLIPKKNLILLRCGGCSGLLKFLLQDRTHTVVPYTPCVLERVPSHGSDSPINDLDLALVGQGRENGDATSCSATNDGGGYISRGSSINDDLVRLKRSNELPVNTDSGTTETPDFYLKQADYESRLLREPLGWNEIVGEMSAVYLGQPQKDDDKPREVLDLDETVEDGLDKQLKHLVDERSETLKPSETTGGDEAEVNSEESGTKCESLSEKSVADNLIKHEDEPAFSLEECIKVREHSSDELECGETEGKKPEFQMGGYMNESEFHMDDYRYERENSSEKHEAGGTMEERPVFHSNYNRSDSEKSSGKFELFETTGVEGLSSERENSSEKLEVNEIPDEKPMSNLAEFVNELETASENQDLSEKLEPGKSLVEKPESHFREFNYDCETLSEKLEPGETIEERPVFHPKHIRNESENSSEILELGETQETKQASYLEEFVYDHETSSDTQEPSDTMEDTPVFHLEEIRNENDNSSEKHKVCKTHSNYNRSDWEESSEKIELGEAIEVEEFSIERDNSSEKLEVNESPDDKPMSHLAESINELETASNRLAPGETMKERPVFHSKNIISEHEDSSEKLEPGESLDEKPASYFGEFINDCETLSEKLEPGKTMEERPVFPSKHIRSESKNSGENLELGETLDEKPVSYLEESINDHETSSDNLEPSAIMEEQPVFHLEDIINENDNSSETESYSTKRVGDGPAMNLDENENKKGNSRGPPKLGETAGKKSKFDLEESEDESAERNELLDTEEVNLDKLMFQLELSQDMQEGPRETPEEDKKESEKTTEKKLSFQFMNKSSTETYETYSQFYELIDPSEIVGLRQVLYPTQGSPLRSPFASPLQSPTGSPLRYPQGSPLRSSIVSPLRSPTSSPFSASNGLSFFSE